MGFESSWIRMVMSCLTTVRYSVLIIGEPSGYITPTRGIRQGDPLSPYLFILCAEGLSSMITNAVAEHSLEGLRMCPDAPILHHLFFADDSLIFRSAVEAECRKYRALLDVYERASGQRINLQKSSVVFSKNVAPSLQAQLAAILEVKCVQEHDRYLGLPLHVGKSKTEIFEYIRESITKKLTSWKTKILSSAGKEIMIKVVAQTMPLYTMNCYLLPKGLCDDLQQLCAQFFWGDTDDKKKIHWRSWDRMCLTKAEGGMGFKNLYAYNLAMLAKQGWGLISNPASLIARLFKARYYPNCSFWEADMGESPSFSWRSILTSRPVLKAGTQWQIGTAQQIDIWKENWIPDVPFGTLTRPVHCEFDMVADLIDGDSRRWSIQVLHTLFPPTIVEKIMCIPLSRNGRSDRVTWKLGKKGFYSVKSAYWVARDMVLANLRASTSVGDPFALLWKALWTAKVPEKVQICLWRACNNLLPTRDRSSTKGYTGELGCLLCSHPYEDSRHVFCACPVAKEILSAAPFNLLLYMSHNFSFKEWILEQAIQMSANIFAKLLMTIWALWKNRNDKLWSDKSQSAMAISLSTGTWYESFLINRYPNAKQKKARVHQFWKAPREGGLKLNIDGAFLP
ncbi:putative RNA-directed DNA polymerase [Rosa chinensis]|uniref:Putative RNA-directed DNA polymerase n=1 Tax=Rosa chinensis TaxID=74649 RepID=A0A2P6QVE0_ROSCH|nr:putative RNA-directed DNA polymerase [Rosa chinensis]